MQTNGNTITEKRSDLDFAKEVPELTYETLRNVYGLGTNYSAANKWYCALPLEDYLSKKYKNLDLHLTLFAIPLVIMGSTTVSYKGYLKEIPTKVLAADNKEITLTYIVDENWQNYKSLYAWISSVEGTINPIIQDTTSSKVAPSEYIPVRIYLLDNYKKKVILFVFCNSWIKIFNDLQLDVSNPNLITHSFTLAYDRYYIEEL